MDAASISMMSDMWQAVLRSRRCALTLIIGTGPAGFNDRIVTVDPSTSFPVADPTCDTERKALSGASLEDRVLRRGAELRPECGAARRACPR
jgi:hypothetical protein